MGLRIEKDDVEKWKNAILEVCTSSEASDRPIVRLQNDILRNVSESADKTQGEYIPLEEDRDDKALKAIRKLHKNQGCCPNAIQNYDDEKCGLDNRHDYEKVQPEWNEDKGEFFVEGCCPNPTQNYNNQKCGDGVDRRHPYRAPVKDSTVRTAFRELKAGCPLSTHNLINNWRSVQQLIIDMLDTRVCSDALQYFINNGSLPVRHAM